MKTVRAILSPEAETAYHSLKEGKEQSKTDQSIWNAVNQKIELIKQNVHYGKPVAKNLIPIEYKQRYGITNLFWVELPQFWRMPYTLTNSENRAEIIAFILDIMDHNQYNKKFGYRKR